MAEVEKIPQTLPPLRVLKSPNQSDRDGAKTRLVVVHTAEGSYEGTVAWLRNPESEASSHIVLNDDGSAATQLVSYGRKAWTQQHFNPVSVSVEVSGKLSTRWLNPVRAMRQLRKLARITAFLLRENGLPATWVRNDRRHVGRGFTRHGDLRPEGGHGLCMLYKGTRWLVFRQLVRWEYNRRDFRREWGRK